MTPAQVWTGAIVTAAMLRKLETRAPIYVQDADMHGEPCEILLSLEGTTAHVMRRGRKTLSVCLLVPQADARLARFSIN